jgi:hypothetical protein
MGQKKMPLLCYLLILNFSPYSQYQYAVEFFSKSILLTAAASAGVLKRIGFV